MHATCHLQLNGGILYRYCRFTVLILSSFTYIKLHVHARAVIARPELTIIRKSRGFAMLCAAQLVLGLAVTIRKADLGCRVDAAAICDVRAPTQYVVEDGAVGFMGQKIKFDAETAHQKRVEARLGTAIRDKATVLIATDDTVEDLTVLGTADLIPIGEGRGRRAGGPALPDNFLLRNLWVAESHRRNGIARRLMCAVEEETAAQGISLLTLEVDRSNEAAIRLYTDLGFEDIDPAPLSLPKFMQSAMPPLFMGKRL